MTREGVEVVTTACHIATTVYNTLTTVNHNNSTYGVRRSDDRLQVGHSAQRI